MERKRYLVEVPNFCEIFNTKYRNSSGTNIDSKIKDSIRYQFLPIPYCGKGPDEGKKSYHRSMFQFSILFIILKWLYLFFFFKTLSKYALTNLISLNSLDE